MTFSVMIRYEATLLSSITLVENGCRRRSRRTRKALRCSCMLYVSISRRSMVTSSIVQRLAGSDVEHGDIWLHNYLGSATAEDESGVYDSRVDCFFDDSGDSVKQSPVRSDVPVSGGSESFFPDSPSPALSVLFSRIENAYALLPLDGFGKMMALRGWIAFADPRTSSGYGFAGAFGSSCWA